jgi:Shikimate kinase
VLRSAQVVYLRVSYDEALARVKSDEFRPMLHRPDLDEVYKRRLSAYEDISVLTVDTDGRRPDSVALEVLARLARLPAIPPVNRVAASLAARTPTAACASWTASPRGSAWPKSAST